MIVYRYNGICQQLEYMANNNCGFANDQGIPKCFYKIWIINNNCGFIDIMPNYQQLLLTKSNNCWFMPTINAGLYTINQQLLRFYNYKPAIIPSLPVSKED